MNTEQIGKLIRNLRLEKGMTQRVLAEKLNVTEQAVSKWERGLGLPDISLLPSLSVSLDVDLGAMLQGSLDENETEGVVMKETHFFICPNCENLTISSGTPDISCCGRPVQECIPVEAAGDERMSLEKVEFDWYITSNHPMKKEDFISFSAHFVKGKVEIYSHYPEWNYELRVPRMGRSKLFWYSRNGGLKYQTLS